MYPVIVQNSYISGVGILPLGAFGHYNLAHLVALRQLGVVDAPSKERRKTYHEG